MEFLTHSTNELRNMDIDKYLNNPNMKPRKNPIHRRFVDRRDDVFETFNIADAYSTEKGTHNLIYRNKNIVVRISKKIFYPGEIDSSYNFNDRYNEVYISYNVKEEDERILVKAMKAELSPRVYYFGNILVDGNIHRYSVVEAYDISLGLFIRIKKHNQILKNEGYYKNKEEIYEDIVNQIVNLIDKMLHLNIVYYDIKPENIVVRMDGNKQLVLKFIDWDSDFCVEEDWLIEDDNRECAKFMEIFILGFYMYRYYNHNIFYNKIIELYNETIKKNLVKLLIDIDSEFLHIILNYFYRSMSMSQYEKENFDYGDDKMIKKVEKDILGLIEKSKNFCKTV